MSSTQLCRVLESDLSELPVVMLGLDANSMESGYAQALLSYLRGDLVGLQKSFKASQLLGWKTCAYLCEMRLAVRTLSSRLPMTPRPKSKEPLWNAELDFVEGMFFENQRNYESARLLYSSAQKHFHVGKAYRKSAKSYHNSVVCQSLRKPTLRLIQEYQLAAKLARDAGDHTTTAAALTNLSREFQLMKASSVAIKYVDQALDLLRDFAYGSYSFYAALCHRSQLYLELGRYHPAITDFEEASAAQFDEIKTALKILRKWMSDRGISLQVNTPVPTKNYLLQTWRERQYNVEADPANLSDLESRFIEILAEGPCDRHQLTNLLWGNAIDAFHLENRLKQLIHRIRKKIPNLVGFEKGKYLLLTDSAPR